MSVSGWSVDCGCICCNNYFIWFLISLIYFLIYFFISFLKLSKSSFFPFLSFSQAFYLLVISTSISSFFTLVSTSRCNSDSIKLFSGFSCPSKEYISKVCLLSGAYRTGFHWSCGSGCKCIPGTAESLGGKGTKSARQRDRQARPSCWFILRCLCQCIGEHKPRRPRDPKAK